MEEHRSPLNLCFNFKSLTKDTKTNYFLCFSGIRLK